MASERIRSMLNGVGFRPITVVACIAKEKGPCDRTLYRPLVVAELGGCLCRIVPMEVSPSVSPAEAVEVGEKWAELL